MNPLIIGIKGHAICIDKNTGEERWTTKLKTTSSVTNISVDGNLVFAYSGGHLFCLDSHTGTIKWENSLQGFGYGPCIISSNNQNQADVSSYTLAQQSAQAASTASTT